MKYIFFPPLPLQHQNVISMLSTAQLLESRADSALKITLGKKSLDKLFNIVEIDELVDFVTI
jgi:hypothetical protein